MPQRGYGLQPRVALRLPWELVRKEISTATRLRLLRAFLRKRRNRVAVEGKFAFFTQGSRSGNPGLEAIAPLGHH